MAQFLTPSQARNFDVNGKTFDLVNLVEALERTPDGWVSPASVNELKLGQIVHVWALGDRLRRGVVAKLGRTKATVVFTTQGAVNDAARYGQGGATLRVANTPVQLSQIKIPAAPVEPTVEAPAAPVEPTVEAPAAPVEPTVEAPVAPVEPTVEAPAAPVEKALDASSELAQSVVAADEEAAYVEAEQRAQTGTEEPAAPVETGTEEPAAPVETGTDDLTLDSQDCKVGSNSKDQPEGDEMTETQATENAPAPPMINDMSGSAVVQTMERVWDRIRENHPELPAVVIVTGTGMIGPARWGHFRANGWMARAEGEDAATNLALGEMFMAGETLARGARQVLETMLHEGAHVIARVRELKDTSRQGRWHNKVFKALAEELGLEHKRASADTQHGFSFVTLTAETEAEYADLLDELDREIRLVVDLPWFLKGTAKPKGEGDEEGEEPQGGEFINGGRKRQAATTPQSGNLRATCSCPEPNIIRASRKVLDLGVIRCDECEELFTAA